MSVCLKLQECQAVTALFSHQNSFPASKAGEGSAECPGRVCSISKTSIFQTIMEPSREAATSSWKSGPSALSVMPAMTHREEREAALAATERKGTFLSLFMCCYFPSWNSRSCLNPVVCARSKIRFLQTYLGQCVLLLS